jgi:elongation factor P
MATGNDLRKGNAMRYQGDVYMVLDVQHRTPGNLRAFVQATLRQLKSGSSTLVRFSSTEPVEIINLSRRKLEYSYRDGSGYIFIDPESFDQITIPAAMADPMSPFLVEGGGYDVLFSDDELPLVLELPSSVSLKVVESPEWLKGDSATNVRKPVKLETGLEVLVPLFIAQGETIKVDTRTKDYISRA